MKRLLVLAVATLTLSGCAGMMSPPAPTIVNLNSLFSPLQAKKMIADGEGVISGSAFLRQRGGGVVTCAGRDVRLIPMTEYARERLGHLYGALDGTVAREAGAYPKYLFVPDPVEYTSATRSTTCDASGKFKFEKVPEGEFFVATSVLWEAPVFDYVFQATRMRVQGGTIGQAVRMSKKEVKEIILSK